MKVKKWLLALAAFAVMAVVCAVAAGAETYGDFEYGVLDNGTVEITKFYGSAYGRYENVSIPEKIDGKNVTSIGNSAFRGTGLVSIIIPNSVTKIGNCAFLDCVNLTNITIPYSVTTIGYDPFSQCLSLTAIDVEVKNKYYSSANGVLFDKDKKEIICYPAGKTDKCYNIPLSVAKIAKSSFSYCSNITEVIIPDSVTEISYTAFKDCSSLVHVTIPNSITNISNYAFNNCSSLMDISIPKSVTSIADSAFMNCSSLTAIDVEIGNPNYSSVNGVLFDKDKKEIICYPGGKADKNYKIPSGVKDIGDFAFAYCSKLTGITIPYGVTSIGWSTFNNCSSLTSIAIPDSVSSIGAYAFYDCTSLTNIKIPQNVTSVEENAFGYYRYYYNKYDNSDKKVDNFKIYCYSGTVGEKYAKDNGFTYELLDKPTLAKVTGVKLSGRAADALRINWTKNASADGYIVEMYQGNKWVRVAKITSNSTTTFRKAGLKAGTAYKFRVKAYKMSGKTAVYGAYSATVAARTNPSVIKGAKLTGRAADALRINWSKNTSADGYIVEMYQGNKWVRVAKITSNSTTTFRKAGLKASTVYKFRVRAYKMSGKTALYGNYSATVTARTNPSVMKGVKIGGKAKDALRVNWAKNTSAQGYIVEMYKGGKWVRAAKITNNSTTTFRKAGLAKNTTYKFRVKAYYMSGKTALYGNYGSVSGKTAAK